MFDQKLKKRESNLLQKEIEYQDKEEELGNKAHEGNLANSNEEEEAASENSQPKESQNSGP